MAQWEQQEDQETMEDKVLLVSQAPQGPSDHEAFLAKLVQQDSEAHLDKLVHKEKLVHKALSEPLDHKDLEVFREVWGSQAQLGHEETPDPEAFLVKQGKQEHRAGLEQQENLVQQDPRVSEVNQAKQGHAVRTELWAGRGKLDHQAQQVLKEPPG